MKVVEVTAQKNAALIPSLRALEQLASYPLGHDHFRIDHGADYFAFFRRLGHLKYYAIPLDGRVAAVAAGILREVPFRKNASPRKTWYLCDLKVHPDYRGKKLPIQMLKRAFFPNVFRCRRGYAISMNPADGRPNRIVRLLGHFRWLPIRQAGNVHMFSLNASAIRSLRPTLEEALGPISFLSMQGKKDLILQSVGTAMPLLHVQHGVTAEQGFAEPRETHEHMFCLPDGSPLLATLCAQGWQPTSTASIIAHGMDDCDWTFILTSDI